MTAFFRRPANAALLPLLLLPPGMAVADAVPPSPRLSIADPSANPPLAGRDAVHVELALEPGDRAGAAADWWLYAATPMGPFSWSPEGRWLPSADPLPTQAPLAAVERFRLIDAPLPAGEYTFHFAVDDQPDARLTDEWADQLTFTVCPFSENLSPFESGNIGGIESWGGGLYWRLAMRADNDNCTLPASWRTWWYARVETPADTPTRIDLTERGWPYYYLPVYSHDGIHWQRPDETEVSQPETYSLRIDKRFAAERTLLARFYPYTLSRLEEYLAGIAADPRVSVESIGESEQGRPIRLVTLTDPSVPDEGKRRVWLHARSHPAETGGSFLLEGMIDLLLGGGEEAALALSQLIFNIVPIHNVDGVVAGNYRTTPDSRNLEVEWRRDPADPFELTADSAAEAVALQRTVAELNRRGPAFSVALNLHSSNSEPDIRPFFYPHFGPQSAGYDQEQAALWRDQLAFISQVARFHGAGMIEPPPEEGGASFVDKAYPESWWWANFGDAVMAITLETTYGRAGYAPEWITPDHLRQLGENVTKALIAYHGLESAAMSAVPPLTESDLRRRSRAVPLRYPELYPPADPNEMKE